MIVAAALGRQSSGASGIAAGASTTGRWDSGNKSAVCTVTGSGTIASIGSATGTIFGDTAISSGKKYGEVTLTNQGPAGGQWAYLGLCGGGTARNDTHSSNKGAGFYLLSSGGTPPSSGQVWVINGPTLGSVGGHSDIVNATILMWAVDMDLGYAWFGSRGAWFRGNPATGILPSATGLTGGAYYLYTFLQYHATTPILTIPSTTSYEAPAGFSIY